MDAERWPLIKDRFSEALGLPLAERRRFLHHLDDATRSEVEALLAAAEPTSGPLDLPFDLSLFGIELPGAVPAGETTATRLPVGTRVGPYVIEERVGRGGMGDVYRARRADGLFERVVAMKMVRADTETVLARFAAERRILGTLEHPGIARLIAAGSETEGPTAGRPWLALEYVDGAPLTEAVRDLGLRERLRLLVEVAEAVHHAHRRLVVHRDLKPSNVLVVEGEDGTRSVKLLDFGIAKIVDPEADPGLTQFDGRSPRTRAYAAPEQIAGQPITTATDVYGLGLLLFEVLAAARPFSTGGGLHALETAILHDDPPLPSAATQPEAGGLDPNRLRGDLDAICLKALAKEPEARYASAEAFAADLQRHLDGVPVEARAPSAWYRARRFVARHRVGVAATALVIVALAVGLGAALWQASEAEAARVEAQQALEETETALGRADAVTEFLKSLFQANDPAGTVGDTLTSIELLALGVERIDEATDDPEVHAQVLQTIGITYNRIGHIEKADSLLRRALELRTQALGPAHPDVASTKGYLSLVLVKTGAYDEAEQLRREALAIQQAALEPPDHRIAMAMGDLGSLLRFLGHLDEAESLTRDALAMWRQLPPEQRHDDSTYDPYLATLLRDFGVILREQGSYAEAEKVQREALGMEIQSTGERHGATAMAMQSLGETLQAKGDFARAESLFTQALDIDREFVGDDHHFIAYDLHLLAGLFHDMGKLEEAEAHFRDALARRRSFLGDDHPRIADNLLPLSAVLGERGEYAEAEQLLLEALAIRRTTFGDSAVQVGEVSQALAVLYEAWDRPERAALYRAPSASE